MRRFCLLGLFLALSLAAVVAAASGRPLFGAPLGGAADTTAAPDVAWLDVPFVKQTRNGCGPAAIAMVVAYWQGQGFAALGNGGDPGLIMAAVYSDSAKGTTGSAMRRYFERLGFRAFAFQGDWSDLGRNISQGRPLIVALGEPRAFHPAASHYAVVAGLDTQHGFVLLNDPARRKLLKTDRAEFERAWDAAGRWTLLAVPGQAQ